MISTPQSREELLLKLVAIPSVTESPEENDAAIFITDHLSKLSYFRENPSHLVMLPTPLEGDEERPLHAVVARMMAQKPTKKTVVFIAHYDVVSPKCYGELEAWAFNPKELAKRFNAEELPARVRTHLLSGDYIFGRGVMDMKCGLALELELLRDYDNNRDLFDLNVIVIVVPDEENTASGMRGAAKYLAELKRSNGLEYIACINTEPSDAGLPDAENQLIFAGTMGKLLPTFYCKGLEAHVGNYFRGFSATLLSSHIVCIAEGAAELADPNKGVCQPSWICLEHNMLSEGYSVTVPNRSLVYFNSFVTTKTPADLMEEMIWVAERAVTQATEQLKKSHKAISAMGYYSEMNKHINTSVLTFADIFKMAGELYEGGTEALNKHIEEFTRALPPIDMRERGLAVLEELISISQAKPPFVAVGFLPPYLPQKSLYNGLPESNKLLSVADRVIEEAKERFGVTIDMAGYYAGLTDLSYIGFFAGLEDVRPYMENCPAWGTLYSVPIEEMIEIDMPIINIGPCGYDAHRKYERLERTYSLETLPHLLAYTLKALSEEYRQS